MDMNTHGYHTYNTQYTVRQLTQTGFMQIQNMYKVDDLLHKLSSAEITLMTKFLHNHIRYRAQKATPDSAENE